MKIVVLDIGGTSIKAGLWKGEDIHQEEGIHQDEDIHLMQEVDTQANLGGTHVIERAIELIRTYSDFDRIGISTAGQVDPVRGTILYANSNIPGYTGMRVKDTLEKEFGVKTYVDNDVNSAAIGEAYYGAGRSYQDFLCLTYGTGVGGAIILNREVYRGFNNSAGEFGAIVTHPEHRREDDNFSGCYERYASTSALVKKAMEFDPALNSGRSIFERIAEPGIQNLVNDWIDEISIGLSSLIHIFNPPAVILGGGILSQKYILDRLNQVLYTKIMESFHEVKLIGAALGNKAGLYGAVHNASSGK